MKNRELSDKELDNMLNAYCKRNVVAFELNKKEQNMKSKIYKYAVCCVAVVLVLSVGVFSPKLFGNTNIAYVPKGFSIVASAAEISDENAIEISEDDIGLDSYTGIEFYDDKTVSLYFNTLSFAVNGDNVVSYDISCEKGVIWSCDVEAKEEMLNGNESILQADYFKRGQTISDIKYYPNNPHRIYTAWSPQDTIYNEISDELNIEMDYEYNEYEKQSIYDYMSSHLNSSEALTKYFGDMLTITVHFEDGTTETAVVDITLEYNYYEAENEIIGYYNVSYR